MKTPIAPLATTGHNNVLFQNFSGSSRTDVVQSIHHAMYKSQTSIFISANDYFIDIWFDPDDFRSESQTF